jgi:hypothetical protein
MNVPARMARRAVVSLLLLGLTVAAGAHAKAADEPSVSYPSRESLATSIPTFQVVQTPAGRLVTLQISPTATIGSTGELTDATTSAGGATLLDVNETTTLATVGRPLHAGVYYWRYGWRSVNANGTTGDLQYSRVKDFTIPGQISAVTLQKPYQDAKGSQAGFIGEVTTNLAAVDYECTVRSGKRVIDRKKGNLSPSALDPARWECLDMSIPESLDGKKLTLAVRFTGDQARRTFTRTFAAK